MRMRSRVTAASILLAAVSMLMPVGVAQATVFAAWEVTNVPAGDVLNVRAYPSAASRKQGAYTNGTVLQMTGKCTGGVDLLDIAGQPKAKQIKAVRGRWCQIWHDPTQTGEFTLGWVRAKYIAPH